MLKKRCLKYKKRWQNFGIKNCESNKHKSTKLMMKSTYELNSIVSYHVSQYGHSLPPPPQKKIKTKKSEYTVGLLK